MYKYNATCIRVIDGDTIDALIDLGFHTHVKKRIRFYGMDAWECRTRDKEEKKKGLAAKARVMQLLDQSNGLFVLHSHGVGKFGRCLGEIYIGDESINQRLIQEGHARKYYGGKR